MPDQILKEVRDIFASVFQDEDIMISGNTTSQDIEDWDSLNNMHLIIAIEKKYNIRFAFGEMASLVNVGSLIGLIEQKIS